MLDFLKRKNPKSLDNTPDSTKSLYARLKQSLSRSRAVFSQGIANLFQGRSQVDEALLEELEALLIAADVGVETTEALLHDLTTKLQRQENQSPETFVAALKQDLIELLRGRQIPLVFSEETKPFVLLMIGVNGTGKTTTIGKLAKKFQAEGKSVMLAAGDTFRAAAIDQLKVWGERNQIPVIAQHSGADSASVIFDAFQTAKVKNVDVLIADTAGRLHTQESLMEELKKVIRVIRKIDEKAPHEIMLVLDASIGQNALLQAKKFHESVGVTGLTLTKLDGTAKGGIIFNIAKTLNLPIRFVGMGEGIDDLRIFEAETFVNALFAAE